MSKIPFPRRKPIAGFGAPIFRSVWPVIEIVIAGLLIAILAFPALVLRTTNANAASTTAPVPYSAPPEPFTINSGATTKRLPLTGWFSSVIALTDAIDGLIHPVAFAGLENARMPTMAEHLRSKAGLATPSSTESAKLPSLTEEGWPKAGVVDPQSAIEPPTQPASVVDFDFDNDGKADVGRWHSANTELKVKNSNGGSYSTFTVGSSSATLAPGDFNGDGKTDAAVFSSGTWTYKTSPSASAQTISWGASGDVPVAGDYDGDGTTDAAIYRPSTTTWWILKSGGGSTSTSFGRFVGDWLRYRFVREYRKLQPS